MYKLDDYFVVIKGGPLTPAEWVHGNPDQRREGVPTRGHFQVKEFPTYRRADRLTQLESGGYIVRAEHLPTPEGYEVPTATSGSEDESVFRGPLAERF